MFAGKNVSLQVHLPGCGCHLSFPGEVNNEAFFLNELEIRILGRGFSTCWKKSGQGKVHVCYGKLWVSFLLRAVLFYVVPARAS